MTIPSTRFQSAPRKLVWENESTQYMATGGGCQRLMTCDMRANKAARCSTFQGIRLVEINGAADMVYELVWETGGKKS
jgi:uncharacterized ParB-like nuclease family protein